jgi:hypothetical protein
MSVPDLERIAGIYNYCDSWCERCGFTSRCATFAIQVAIEMCSGDVKEGIELAIGQPPPMTQKEARRRETLADDLAACTPTEAEVQAYAREEEARRARVEEHPVTAASLQVSLLTRSWLRTRGAPEISRSPRAADALEIVRWDEHLIPAKLGRALDGLDEYLSGECVHDDPVQNDWNGTAKLALLCIRRSKAAWVVLAEELADSQAADVARHLSGLEREVERTFPGAEQFVRPGFDEPRG